MRRTLEAVFGEAHFYPVLVQWHRIEAFVTARNITPSYIATLYKHFVAIYATSPA